MAAPSTFFHALRQPVFMTVRRGAFLYYLEEVNAHEVKVYQSRLWDSPGL